MIFYSLNHVVIMAAYFRTIQPGDICVRVGCNELLRTRVYIMFVLFYSLERACLTFQVLHSPTTKTLVTLIQLRSYTRDILLFIGMKQLHLIKKNGKVI